MSSLGAKPFLQLSLYSTDKWVGTTAQRREELHADAGRYALSMHATKLRESESDPAKITGWRCMKICFCRELPANNQQKWNFVHMDTHRKAAGLGAFHQMPE